MGHGWGDKYDANHPAHCSLLVWVLYLVRYFKSSPVKLVDTNTSPSLSIFAVETNLGSVIGTLLSIGLMFLGFTSLGAAFFPGCPFRSAFSELMLFIFRKASGVIKVDLRLEKPMPFIVEIIEMASMVVDWNPHNFLACIGRSGSICYLER